MTARYPLARRRPLHARSTPGRARACVTDPVLFASTDVLDHTLAARLCDVCPVAVSCREAVDATAEHRPDLLTGTYAGRRFAGAA